MTHPGPVSGSRGNGLPGSAWVRLADVDPRVADDLLDQLAGEGIAAYAAPAQDTDVITGAPTTPRMRDRLYVDRSALDRAKALLPSDAPEDAAVDLDTAWQDVLASLRSGEPRPVVAPWPESEEVRGAFEPEPYDEEAEEAAYEEDHFEPPPPPPLPRVAPATVVAVLAIIVGVVMLFVQATQTTEGVLAALALVVGGCATLIYRMREGPPNDDNGPDDGAVV